MGIFALASRGAMIESTGWRVTLSVAHFCGREEFAVECSDRTIGTKISLPLTSTEVNSARETVESSAYYYPLPVYFAGEEVKRGDLLQLTVHHQLWNGVEIGVVPWKENLLNFYGLRVYQQLPSVELVGGARLGVCIQVINAPELKLVLPARKEVVINEFFESLSQECYRVIYRYVATLKTHQLPYKNWQQANLLGVSLPQARPQLELYQPERADDQRDFSSSEQETQEDALLVTAELSPPVAQSFWRGFEQAGYEYELYQPQAKYQGYSWYDNLPKLCEIDFSIEKDGQVKSLGEDLELLKGNRPDFIWVKGTVSYPNGNNQQLVFSTDVALVEDAGCLSCDLDASTILVSKDSKISTSELIELLEAAYFYPSDDIEADSTYTQQEDFIETATQVAAQTLLSDEYALIERIELVVERHLRWLIPSDRTIEITIGHKVGVKLKQRHKTQ